MSGSLFRLVRHRIAKAAAATAKQIAKMNATYTSWRSR